VVTQFSMSIGNSSAQTLRRQLRRIAYTAQVFHNSCRKLVVQSTGASVCFVRGQWAWKPYWLNAELLFRRQQFRQHQYDRISQVYIDQFHIRIADIQCLSGKRQYSMYEYTQLCRKPPKNPQNSHVKTHATNHGQRPCFSFRSQASNDATRSRQRDQSDQSHAFRKNYRNVNRCWSGDPDWTKHASPATIIWTWMATEAAILIGSSRSNFGARKFAIGMHGNEI